MRYFNEMDSKYGFDSGQTIPEGIDKYREIYCIVLNKLLEKNQSKCRILPLEGSGTKNPCLWIRVSVADYNQQTDKLDPIIHELDEVKEDEQWEKSIEEANELGLDDLIEVQVNVNQEKMQKILENI